MTAQAFINEHLRRNGLNPDEKDDESNATGRVSKRKRERLVAEAEESAEKSPNHLKTTQSKLQSDDLFLSIRTFGTVRCYFLKPF